MVIMKHMKIKAQRYWRTPNSLRIYGTKTTAQYYCGFAADKVAPAYVLPADAASVEATTMQAAEGLHAHMLGNKEWSPYELARAALAAIGIKGGKSK